jgi:heme exporter protein D
MQWHSVSDFLAMGGYGLYVWGSFGVTAFALAAEMWLIRRRQQALRANLHHEFLEESSS